MLHSFNFRNLFFLSTLL